MAKSPSKTSDKAKASKPAKPKGARKAEKEAEARKFRDKRLANYIPHIKDIF